MQILQIISQALRIIQLLEIGLDLGPRSPQQRTQNSAFGKLDPRVDAAEPLGPGSAQELHQDGLGLVVEGVGGEDGVGMAVGKELLEEVVAEVAGGLLQTLMQACGGG